jgi:2-dehydropantoate 2-reductase
LVREAMQEVIAVAQAEGVALPAGLIDLMLHVTRSEFPETEPSMLQDVRAGRATEVDILQGAVVRRAAAHGLAVPIHRTLEGLLRGRTGQTATATAPRSA